MLISNKFCLQNLSSTDVQGSTSVEKYTDVHFSSGTVHTVCVSSRGDKPHESQDCRCCCRGCCCSVYRRRSSSRYCSNCHPVHILTSLSKYEREFFCLSKKTSLLSGTIAILGDTDAVSTGSSALLMSLPFNTLLV